MNPSSTESTASANGSPRSSPVCSQCSDCGKRFNELETALENVLGSLNAVQNSLEERRKLDAQASAQDEQCIALLLALNTTLNDELKQKLSRSELVDVNSRLNSLLSLYRMSAQERRPG